MMCLHWEKPDSRAGRKPGQLTGPRWWAKGTDMLAGFILASFALVIYLFHPQTFRGSLGKTIISPNTTIPSSSSVPPVSLCLAIHHAGVVRLG